MSRFKGVLQYNEPLAPYTAWRIGGPAEVYYRPSDHADLAVFLASRPIDEPINFLGLGSNVLISDQGLPGTVIHLLGSATHRLQGGAPIQWLEIDHAEHSKALRIEAGVPCAQVAKFCAQQGLQQAEFFAGIPGTIGGALAMNAGAWGCETWQQVLQVEVINRHGQCYSRPAKDYRIGYRQVIAPQDEWFVAGYFHFEGGGDPVLIAQKIKELLRTRNQTQPIGVFSGGSVFKNPSNDYAGRLIEASHLKGARQGDAVISTKHANFIINEGKATAADVYELITHMQATVLRDHQVSLEPEVRFLGF